MRPSDLVLPEKRKQGLNVIHDGIVFLNKTNHIGDKTRCVEGEHPSLERADDFTFPSWEELFGNNKPVRIEYCSGNGAWIASQAATYPEINWVAVEIKFGRTKKIWSKIKNQQLENLIVVNGEGEFATQNYFPKGGAEAIYINFPDPWPKRHHAKYRIVKPSFVQAMSKVLQKDGQVTIVTDDVGFSEWTLKIFKQFANFSSVFDAPFFITEWPNYGDSYFDTLWREKGRDIRYHQFSKIKEV